MGYQPRARAVRERNGRLRRGNGQGRSTDFVRCNFDELGTLRAGAGGNRGRSFCVQAAGERLARSRRLTSVGTAASAEAVTLEGAAGGSFAWKYFL